MARVRGVYWSAANGKWRASCAGKYLGEFEYLADACDARRAAEIAIYGEAHVSAEIRVGDAEASIPIYSRAGQVKAWATIDIGDLPLVKGHRWSLTRSGYAVARVGGRIVYLHRLLVGDAPCVDHRDRDKLNNRRLNLRPCRKDENSRNRQAGVNNRSGFKGVSLTPLGRWRARIMINRREVALGIFSTAEAAARAYDAAALKLHGPFASPNSSFHPQPELTIEVRTAGGLV